MDRFLINKGGSLGGSFGGSSSSATAATTASTGKTFSSSATTLKLLSWNIDSITTKSGDHKSENKLELLLERMGVKPDIINLQETKRSKSEGMPRIANYMLIASALCDKGANGCAVYVKTILNSSSTISKIEDFDESIDGKKQGRLVGIRISNLANGPIALFGVYAVNTLGRNVDRKKELERKSMDEVLRAQIASEVSRDSRTRIVVAGDLNVTMSLLDKGKHNDTSRWGESHFEDITSPIDRVTGLMNAFKLEDTWRESVGPQLKVHRDTRTTTYAANSTFGKGGCRLDYILVSKREGELKKTEEDLSSDSDSDGPLVPPSKRQRKEEPLKWWSNSVAYYGKGWRLSNDQYGNGSDHLPTIIELEP